MTIERKFFTQVSFFIVFSTLCLLVGNATGSEIYRCKLKNGKTEMRDFPCEESVRAPDTNSKAATTGTSASRGFASNQQYTAARSQCAQLLTKYDALAPSMRCSFGDSACFKRAEDESRAIQKRLSSLPEWRQNQCDLVLVMEGHAGTPDQAAGCSRKQILSPSPFMGTADEVITLSDGSVWKDVSYKYLYLYAYNPQVLICSSSGKMTIEHGGATHTFSVGRLK